MWFWDHFRKTDFQSSPNKTQFTGFLVVMTTRHVAWAHINVMGHLLLPTWQGIELVVVVAVFLTAARGGRSTQHDIVGAPEGWWSTVVEPSQDIECGSHNPLPPRITPREGVDGSYQDFRLLVSGCNYKRNQTTSNLSHTLHALNP